MVRQSTPFDHKVANRRFWGIIMKVEDDTAVVWIGLAVPLRRRRRKAK
jgi:hypothetical protein